MIFSIICKDFHGKSNVRAENRAEHIKWLNTISNNKLKLAGPFIDDEGNMCGSMLIIEADNKTAIEDLLQEDPYAKANLFQSVEIVNYNPVITNFD